MSDRLFAFKAIDGDQAVIEGLLTAATPRAARERLRKEVGRVISIQEIIDEAEVPPKISARAISREALSMYTRQLGLLLRAGVHLQRALSLVARGDSLELNLVFMWMAADVDRGHSMSDAMSKFPQVFSPLYLSLIRAAEVSGLLDTNLERLGSVLDNAVRLRRRVMAAFAYPVVISLVAFAVLAVFVFFILPTIRPSYDEMGLELPWLTRAVMSLSDMSVNPLMLTPICILGVLGARRFHKYAQTPEGKLAVETRVRRIPIFGPTLDKQEVTAVLYILATMLDAGIPLGTAIRVSSHGGSSVRMQRGLARAEECVMNGATITEAFKYAEIFPNAVIHMIEVGEESGTMGHMMRCAVNLYELEIERNLSNMATLLEPLVMMGVGGIVGIITLAAFLPSISLMNQF